MTWYPFTLWNKFLSGGQGTEGLGLVMESQVLGV